MSFNVDPPAARAAGFIRGDLLKRNTQDNKRGQAVVETLDCKDLILAPEYNLKEKLRALDKRRQSAPLPNGKRTTIITPANTLKLPEQEDGYRYQQPPEKRQNSVTDAVDTRSIHLVHSYQELDGGADSEGKETKIIPILPEKGRRAEDIDLNAA